MATDKASLMRHEALMTVALNYWILDAALTLPQARTAIFRQNYISKAARRRAFHELTSGRTGTHLGTCVPHQRCGRRQTSANEPAMAARCAARARDSILPTSPCSRKRSFTSACAAARLAARNAASLAYLSSSDIRGSWARRRSTLVTRNGMNPPRQRPSRRRAPARRTRFQPK